MFFKTFIIEIIIAKARNMKLDLQTRINWRESHTY